MNAAQNVTKGISQLYDLHSKVEFFLMKYPVTHQKPYIHTSNQTIGYTLTLSSLSELNRKSTYFNHKA